MLTLNTRGHLLKVLQGLHAAGWQIDKVPGQGTLMRNGQKFVLTSPGLEIKIRLFVYKVTGSGRSRPNERRIEITTTYHSGLQKARGFHDVVLGYNEATDSFVGVDSRRLSFGGTTHNASSFFDLEGIKKTKAQRLLIMSRKANRNLFSTEIEYHGFFDQTKLAEYLFNYSEIHNGTYTGSGSFSAEAKMSLPQPTLEIPENHAAGDLVVLTTSRQPQSKVKVNNGLVKAVEGSNFKRLKQARLTPGQLRDIMRYCEEVGSVAEQYVVDHERRRLTRLGHVKAASEVERVSLTSVGEGYDIISFEDDGVTKRFLEVKGTTGAGMTVDMSDYEWETAKLLKNSYYLVRVIRVKTNPSHSYFQNPVELEQHGALTRLPNGWRVKLPKQA
jgi:hypothetical protein